MDSITKTKVTKDEILEMISRAFGEGCELENIKELTEGYFNTAYLISFKNGSNVVLKIAPRDNVKVMSYEKNLMETEVYTLNKIHALGTVPVPEVLFYDNSEDIINSHYFFMDFIEGEALNKVSDKLSQEQQDAIYSQLGEYTKEINQIDGEYFGSISQKSKRFSTWSEAFLSMIKELLIDADEMKVHLPYTHDELYIMISQYQAILNKVNKPSLVHKDLWEGNIFVDMKTAKITGIVDCERALFGDLLLEPVCGFLLENKRFMDAYLKKTVLNEEEYLRCDLYKVYLFLLMIIEGAYRQYPDNSIEEWARAQLTDTLKSLKNREKMIETN